MNTQPARIGQNANLARIDRDITPPAGWYPDPSGAPKQRYFDGTDWTAHWAPVVSEAPYGRDPMTGEPMSDKSRVVAGVLQLFFPGVGRLYIGTSAVGIWQLCLFVFGLLSLVFFIGFFVLLAVGVWSIVDGIMILAGNPKDQYGRKLRS